MKLNNYILILFTILFINILMGCQQVPEVLEQESNIEIVSEDVEERVEAIDDELEKEFDDGLDEALAELEEIKNI